MCSALGKITPRGTSAARCSGCGTDWISTAWPAFGMFGACESSETDKDEIRIVNNILPTAHVKQKVIVVVMYRVYTMHHPQLRDIAGSRPWSKDALEKGNV